MLNVKQVAFKFLHILSGISRKRSHFYFVQILHRIKSMLIRNTWLILLPRGAIFSSSDKLELGKVKWSNESYQMLMHMEDRCDMFKQNHLPSLRPWSCIDRPFIYGLTTAELPWWQDIHRSLSNSLVCDRVKAINMIIWDEASMSGRRLLELVNVLHHDLADDLGRMSPFAGK